MYCTNTHIHKTKRKKHNHSCFQSKHNFIPYNRLKQKVRKSSNKIFQAQASSSENTYRVYTITEMLLSVNMFSLSPTNWAMLNFEMFFFSAYILGRKYSFIAVGRFYRKCTRRVLGTSPQERKIFPEHSGDPEIAAWQEFHHKYRCSFTKTEPLKKQ